MSHESATLPRREGSFSNAPNAANSALPLKADIHTSIGTHVTRVSASGSLPIAPSATGGCAGSKDSANFNGWTAHLLTRKLYHASKTLHETARAGCAQVRA